MKSRELINYFCRYIVYFALFIILNLAKTSEGLVPFALGLFVALVFSGQNIFPLSAIYISASYLIYPSWDTLIISVALCAVICAAYYIHYLFRKPVRLLTINIYAFLGQLPKLLLADGSEIYSVFVGIIIAQLFAYCTIVIVYAVLVRGFKFRLTGDETVCGAIFVMALALGLYNIEILGVKPFFAVAAFAVLMVCSAAGGGTATLLAVCLGTGAALSDGSFVLIGALTFWAALSSIFRHHNYYLSALILIVGEAVIGFYFEVYGAYSLYQLVTVCVGTAVFCLVKPATLKSFAAAFSGAQEGYAARTIVNRSRADIAGRLNELRLVYNEMENVIRLSIKKNTAGADRSKLIMAEQMSGVGMLLSDISVEIGKGVAFDSVKEKAIIDELALRGIYCKEAVVYGDKGEAGVTVVVRYEDAGKASIVKAVGRILKQRMILRTDKSAALSGLKAVHLIPAPKFDLVFGEKCTVKPMSPVSGDNRSIIRVTDYKFLVALCDGMGSGRDANASSNTALTLLENLYRAGLPDNTIISIANHLLSEREGESFSALDVAIFDLSSGTVDMLKMAAREGIIKRRDGVELIEGNSLPFGVLKEMQPSLIRRTLSPDDILVLLSDGIIDTLGIDAVADYVSATRHINPQAICDEIIERAYRIGARDDMTVMAVRMYKKF